jgi:hypothetical protein
MTKLIGAVSILAAATLLGGCTARGPLSPRGVINPPGRAGLVLTSIVLDSRTPFMTRQSVLMRSQDSAGRDYDLLAGPYPWNAGEIGIGTHNSITTAALTGEAYSFVIGYMPITRSKRVLAGSVGTTYAMRVSDSTSSDLVIVLEAKAIAPVQCELLDPATGAGLGTKTSVPQGKYVKVSMNGQTPVFGDVKDIPKVGAADPDNVLAFLAYVQEKAVAASLTTEAKFDEMVDLPPMASP